MVFLTERRGIDFQQSACDPFIRIGFFYVNSFFWKEEQNLTMAVRTYMRPKMWISIGMWRTGFLEVFLSRYGTITLTQTGLIPRVLNTMETLGRLECKRLMYRKLPCPEGEPIRKSYNYASMVGMLIYLIPGQKFAVHQCTIHCHSPKAIHGRYLEKITSRDESIGYYSQTKLE